MPSILQKCHTLLSANMVGLVDRTLEIQSTKIIDEYLHQLEKNLDVLEASTEMVTGTVKTLKRKYEKFAEQAKKNERDVDTLILRSKDELPVLDDSWGLHTKAELAQEYYEQWKAQEEQYNGMVCYNGLMKDRIVYVRELQSEFRTILEDNQTIDTAKLYDYANIEQKKFENYLEERKK